MPRFRKIWGWCSRWRGSQGQRISGPFGEQQGGQSGQNRGQAGVQGEGLALVRCDGRKPVAGFQQRQRRGGERRVLRARRLGPFVVPVREGGAPSWAAVVGMETDTSGREAGESQPVGLAGWEGWGKAVLRENWSFGWYSWVDHCIIF